MIIKDAAFAHIEFCTYCGNPLGIPFAHKGVIVTLRKEMDHFVPRSQGGSNSPHNLYVVCDVCNNYKLDKLFPSVESVASVCREFWKTMDSVQATRIKLACIGKRRGSSLGGKTFMKRLTKEDRSRIGKLGGKIGGKNQPREVKVQIMLKMPRESKVKGAQNQPREAKVRGGKLGGKNQSLEDKSKAGKIGAKNQPREVRVRNGQKSMRKMPRESIVKGAVLANHNRWHLSKSIYNPNCKLCLKTKAIHDQESNFRGPDRS